VLCPEKPRPALHVGITGHRWNKLQENERARIERQLRDVLAAIDASAGKAVADAASFFAETSATIRLLSGLAEGADEMAVRLRPPLWEVCAVLPFTVERYAQDFAPDRTGDGRGREAEFRASLAQCRRVLELPSSEGEAEAYARIGEFIARESDLLVAVWDGEAAAGPGGTGSVVAKAVERNIPVVWISSGEDRPVRLIGRTGDESRPDLPEARSAIPSLVDAVLAPPAAGPQRAALSLFFGERWRQSTLWVAFDWLKRFPHVWTWRLPLRLRGREEQEQELRAFEAQVPWMGRTSASALPTRIAFADTLATYFAHAYRSAYMSTYLLSVLALAIALIEILPVGPSDPTARLPFKAVLSVCELVLVATVIGIVAYGRRASWHRRWLDYRALAERLRHLRFLTAIGDADPQLETADTSEEASDWVAWYVRATAREIGPPSGILDAQAQRTLLEAVLTVEIDPQIAYHHANERALQRFDHGLHRLGLAAFFLSGAMLVLSLATYLFTPGLSPFLAAPAGHGGFVVHAFHAFGPWSTYFDAVLPAVGAALSGIRSTGEFEVFAERSRETAAALSRCRERCVAAAAAPTLERTHAALAELAKVLSEDMGEWRALYRRKQLVLPA
jgi:hypothetical protein